MSFNVKTTTELRIIKKVPGNKFIIMDMISSEMFHVNRIEIKTTNIVMIPRFTIGVFDFKPKALIKSNIHYNVDEFDGLLTLNIID